jgi:NADH-quinone oxidoreductase subunit J
MVLFVFVVMMLNIGPASEQQERQWLSASVWTGPTFLAAILLLELGYMLAVDGTGLARGADEVSPEAVGIALFGPYLLAVELASMLLLAGLVGAYHLGARSAAGEEAEP